MIISASRRTDIPAYYSEWFINRLKAGYVYVRNPMNYSQVSNIPLSPNLVDCIVFWTKNVSPIIEKLPNIENMGYTRYYFQYTITPYDNTLERNVPSKDDIISSVIRLSETIGKNRIVWRYDPIIIKDKFDLSFHEKAFEDYCSRLYKYCHHVVISFIDIYSHIHRSYDRPSEKDIAYLSKAFMRICENYHLPVQSCCENELEKYGISKGSCIDSNLISEICGETLQIKKDNNQRKSCLCCESIDIGTYNTCLHGCTYCYANKNKSLSVHYDMHSPLLCSTLSSNDKLYNKKVVSHLKGFSQLSLF